MTEVLNLQALRSIIGNSGDTVYAKGHTNAGDGGGGIFIWRTGTAFTGTGTYNLDNNGTIVKANSNDTGRWIRQYEDQINVLFFGAFGVTGDYTSAIQNAVNFAALNTLTDTELKGSTIFIPNGSYKINTLLLKSGISIVGESIEKTIIYTTDNHAVDYMFKIDIGPVFLNISKLNIVGRDTNAGCFLFEAQRLTTSPYHGGLWQSRISDLKISGFKGNGIYLYGGGTDSNYLLPNQFNIFENVRVNKSSDFSRALLMTGQNGQISFINCTFDGFYKSATYSKGQNIKITNEDKYTSSVVSFINCTCQQADYGFNIGWAENITIDNCWFENLGVAITVKSNIADPNNEVLCKSINILNNKFANASGFGSLNAPNNIKAGQCISVSKSFVNVFNNYVTVSEPEGQYFNNNSSFLLASNNVSGGINISGNNYRENKLGKTFGIMQAISVAANAIDCFGNKLVFVNSSTSIIKTIKSIINAGEHLTVRANGTSITFDNTDNIFLTNKTSLTIYNGEIVTFMKIDNTVGSNYETYQLVSIVRAST